MTDAPRLSLESMIGSQIRTLRQTLGMTIADLAGAAGLSSGMLSKVENGQTSPSLTTLQSLASALNMPLASLFTKFDQKSDATFVKAGEGIKIERRASAKDHVYQLLGHALRTDVRVEPYRITLDATSDAYPIFQHDGVEFLYMLEGAMTYAHGDSTYAMTPGDSLYFDAAIAHGPLEMQRLPAVYISVIVTPLA
ncbi:MAG: XRE family transcriptional regulator [Pseudomonadota bacterium]